MNRVMDILSIWAKSYSDITYKEKVRSLFLATLCLVLFVMLILEKMENSKIVDLIETKIQSTKVILTPAVQREVVIEANDSVSTSFLKAFVDTVVDYNENWLYWNIKEGHNTLFKLYYTHDLANITRANIKATKFYKIVESQKLVSKIEIDEKLSKYDYCSKLKRVCAVVVGTRRLRNELNQEYQTQQVAYFIQAKLVRPVPGVQPMALKATKVDLFDKHDDNYERAINLLKQAKEMN